MSLFAVKVEPVTSHVYSVSGCHPFHVASVAALDKRRYDDHTSLGVGPGTNTIKHFAPTDGAVKYG